MRQFMIALDGANEVRRWLASQKVLIDDGDVERWYALCQSGDRRLKSVTLFDFLQWLPKVGPGKAKKVIAEVFPWPTTATYQRRVDRLDLATALRLNEAVRRVYERVKIEERVVAC